ncbi:hypothetical protein K440DRAFT_634890 [Wilcoxina mikolae CBS 423.85]|nr:hypothetical protein K440DRAFT_634890 [Wilcoxina mikolae CBS 423.85]
MTRDWSSENVWDSSPLTTITNIISYLARLFSVGLFAPLLDGYMEHIRTLSHMHAPSSPMHPTSAAKE